MLHPSRWALVALLALLLALAACGGDSGNGGEAAAPAEEQAAVLVTRDCGQEVVVERTDVPAGQTALQALDRVADIETDSGGRFVTAVEGVEQDEEQQLAWLVYVNGEMAETGAAEITLQAGDVEWWDLHDWDETCRVPAEARQ
ncbi:MAG TPA: DUF4430 domain-containing protein [Gaiellaceae bacterium]|nr:DUF4430 domain-containing protein [Gaiellaceae bacterium]